MIKDAKAFTRVLTVMVAAGCCGGFIVHCGELLAQQPTNKKKAHPPDPWIGNKVVAKYGTFVGVGSQKPNTARILRVYTVQERQGDRLRLESEGSSGWIEATEVVLLDDAIDFYTQEIRAKPTSAAAYHQRGLIWAFKEENDKAIADDTAAIRIDPQNARAYLNRGHAWAGKKDYDTAIADYTKAIQIEPNTTVAFDSRGYAWSCKNDYDRSIADYTEAIRLDPSYADTYVRRGYAWSEKGDYDKAIADYTEAIRFHPRYADTYARRGNAWSEKGDYGKAIADYTEALRISPKDSSAYANRGARLDQQKGIRQGDRRLFRGYPHWTRKTPTLAIIAAPTGPKRRNTTRRSPISRRPSGSIPATPGLTATAAVPGPRSVNTTTQSPIALEAIGLDPRHARAYYNRGIVLTQKFDFRQRDPGLHRGHPDRSAVREGIR